MAEEVLRGCREAGAEADVIAVDNYLVRPIGEVCDKTSDREIRVAMMISQAYLRNFLVQISLYGLHLCIGQDYPAN